MTVHTSELGEQLAQKWASHRWFAGTEPDTSDREDVNFMLDAIADEVEANLGAYGGFEQQHKSGVDAVARWLRGGRDD